MVLMAGRDARPEFPVGPFYVKQCSLHGFVMFKASSAEMRESAAQINDWLASGAAASEYLRHITVLGSRRSTSNPGKSDAELRWHSGWQNRLDRLMQTLTMSGRLFNRSSSFRLPSRQAKAWTLTAMSP